MHDARAFSLKMHLAKVSELELSRYRIRIMIRGVGGVIAKASKTSLAKPLRMYMPSSSFIHRTRRMTKGQAGLLRQLADTGL